jgi:hypothetical protein
LERNELHTIYYYENGQLHHLTEEPDALVYVNEKLIKVDCTSPAIFINIGSMPCEHVARWDGLRMDVLVQ